MSIPDWIVIGNGLAGAALSYELAKVGFAVLLLEQAATPLGATRFSYGGIAYWSGTTELTRQLCQEGIELHRDLSAELEADTQFCIRDLLLTIEPDRDPAQVASAYSVFTLQPELLTPEAACQLEPLLNRQAISGALRLPHGHVSPEATVRAYNQALLRLGGTIQTARVTGLSQVGDRVTGVVTSAGILEAANVAVCAGGMSRSLLQAAKRPVYLYYTQAEIVEILTGAPQLRVQVMPAELKRFDMEAKAGRSETNQLWDEPGHEIVPPILDIGIVQFRDGTLRLGQISRALTDPSAQVDARQSEREIRAGVGQLVPTLQNLPGAWHCCLVAFSGDRLPLVGALPHCQGVYLFSGFSNPFAFLPPIARRFARSIVGQPDEIISKLSLDRFVTMA